jgi:hypothetical protein
MSFLKKNSCLLTSRTDWLYQKHWGIELQGNIAWWDNSTRSFQRLSSQTTFF